MKRYKEKCEECGHIDGPVIPHRRLPVGGLVIMEVRLCEAAEMWLCEDCEFNSYGGDPLGDQADYLTQRAESGHAQ